MNLLNVILAGIVGTALMTLFLYGLTFLTKRVMKVTKILGTLLTNETTPAGGLSDSRRAATVGVIAHYAIGVAFALLYYGLWSLGIGRPDGPTGILFGIGSGLAAIGFWYALLKLHPRPPAIALGPYLMSLFVAHIVFTFGVIAAYNSLLNLTGRG